MKSTKSQQKGEGEEEKEEKEKKREGKRVIEGENRTTVEEGYVKEDEIVGSPKLSCDLEEKKN